MTHTHTHSIRFFSVNFTIMIRCQNKIPLTEIRLLYVETLIDSTKKRKKWTEKHQQNRRKVN